MAVPKDYAEYEKLKNSKLSRWESFLDSSSGLDERVDIVAMLLIEVLNHFKKVFPATPAEGPAFSLSEHRNFPTFITGQKNIDAASTGYQLPGIPVPTGASVTIIAHPANTGTIYISASKIEAETASVRFDGLSAGLAVSLRVSNLSSVWVSGDTANDGISYIVEREA